MQAAKVISVATRRGVVRALGARGQKAAQQGSTDEHMYTTFKIPKVCCVRCFPVLK
jgi:hypothetical protein